MAGLFQDVLAREAPVAPSEVANLVEREQVERGGRGLLESVGLEGERERAVANVLEELAVIARPVVAEVLEDGGEGRVGHGNAEEIVAERDLWMPC